MDAKHTQGQRPGARAARQASMQQPVRLPRLKRICTRTLGALCVARSFVNALQELVRHWMKDHSLRGLHGAQHFAESTASLFAALYQRFDFQVDNVRLGWAAGVFICFRQMLGRNQFDHLLSLWRSHCAILADLDLEHEEEGDFLTEAVPQSNTGEHDFLQ